jgi:hypothetical protein
MCVLGGFENGTTDADIGIEYLYGTYGFPIAVYLDVGEDCILGLILGHRPMWMSVVVMLVYVDVHHYCWWSARAYEDLQVCQPLNYDGIVQLVR